MTPLIEIKDLVFEYADEFAALQGVNIDINPGEFVAILGHNGSGKSTLAKHLNALLTPKSGTVIVKGKDSSKPENVWDIRQTAGMVFQNPDNQIIATIVEEDVAFGLENLGVPSKEIRERVDNALEAVSMQDFAEYAPHFLSGGQKQRVAIAGIIAMKPDCIILDEATAMLDPTGRKDVMSTITELNSRDHITIIHITHFMEEAAMAGRVIVMEDGRVVLDGTPNEVFKEVPLLKRLGLDVPQITELTYRLRQEGIDCALSLTIDEFTAQIERVEQLCPTLK